MTLSKAHTAPGKDAQGTAATTAMLPDGPVLLVVGDHRAASQSPPLDEACLRLLTLIAVCVAS